MIKLETTAPKVWAKYENSEFVSGSEICLPDDADTSIWKEFESEQAAKDFFGIVDPMTDAEMLIGLGIQPNEVTE